MDDGLKYKMWETAQQNQLETSSYWCKCWIHSGTVDLNTKLKKNLKSYNMTEITDSEH